MEGDLASRELPYPDYFYFNLFTVNSPCSAFCPAFFDVQWVKIRVGGGTLLWEGERIFSKMKVSYYKVLRLKKRPFEQRELISEVA